jgi:hypothetical protein
MNLQRIHRQFFFSYGHPLCYSEYAVLSMRGETQILRNRKTLCLCKFIIVLVWFVLLIFSVFSLCVFMSSFCVLSHCFLRSVSCSLVVFVLCLFSYFSLYKFYCNKNTISIVSFYLSEKYYSPEDSTNDYSPAGVPTIFRGNVEENSWYRGDN